MNKVFEIKAKIPVTAISTEIYKIYADTEEEALQKFKTGDFDKIYSLTDRCELHDVELINDSFKRAEIINIEEYE